MWQVMWDNLQKKLEQPVSGGDVFWIYWIVWVTGSLVVILKRLTAIKENTDVCRSEIDFAYRERRRREMERAQKGLD